MFNNTNTKVWLIIGISFLAALILTYIPLPTVVNFFRPEWLALVVLFWVLIAPYRVGIITAWILGLILDVADGSTLGIHALAFVMIAYLAIRFRSRILKFNLIWQSAVIALIILVYQTVIYWVSGMVHVAPDSLLYWFPTLTSALFWPWIYVLLRDIYQKVSMD